MSSQKKVRMAQDVTTSKEQLAKLCKRADLQLLDALTDNLNTPDDALHMATIKALLDKKHETRDHAAKINIYKIRHNRKSEWEVLKVLEMMLIDLLKETDWIRKADISTALGELGSRIATDTICTLMHIAYTDYEMYKSQETLQILEGKIIRLKTDTDLAHLSPSEVFQGFVTSAIMALGKIGDTEALDDIASIGEKDDYFKSFAESAIKKIKKQRK